MVGRLCLVLVVLAPLSLCADEKIDLREKLSPGDTGVVTLEFKAQGSMHFPQAGNKTTSQTFSAQGRVAFEEKILAAGVSAEEGNNPKTLRYYNSASVESVVETKRSVHELRETVRLMVGELRNGKPFLFSPSGPLTIQEHELVEAEAHLDSLVLGELLPAEPVARGEKWRPNDSAIAAVFNFSKVAQNEIDAELERADEDTARIRLSGRVEGTAAAAATRRTIKGHIIFDRARSKVTEVELTQSEERSPGPISPGLTVGSTSTVRRDFAAPIVRLNDPDLEELPLEPNPATEQLVYSHTDGRYRFHFPRGWRVFQSDHRVVVLRFVENDEILAQCNVVPAPTVAAGTHMKPDEFRKQVQEALGAQFGQFIQEGEVTAAKGHWVYRLAAAGTAGEFPVVWYYYLAAGPQGQQLVFIFRVGADRVEQFGPKDLALVGSVEFSQPRTASNRKEP